VVAVRGGLPGEVDLVLERIEVIREGPDREYVPKIFQRDSVVIELVTT